MTDEREQNQSGKPTADDRGVPRTSPSNDDNAPLPHVIRLRGPWQYEPLARTVLLPDGSTREEAGLLPSSGRHEMPADWGDSLGADFFGRVLYCRRFGKPTGLAGDDRVILVIDGVDAFGRVSLNGVKLGDMHFSDGSGRFDITESLKSRNDLAILVELPRVPPNTPPLPRPGREGLPGGIIGEVRLEIFSPSRL